ncbi:hypothetical protein ACK3ZI_08435 [Aeromonas caviae]
METSGAECELGGGGSGGDDGGGDNGGGNTGGAPYYYPFKDQISPIGVGGQYQEATTAALKQIDEDLRWTAIKLYGQGEESLATFKTFSRDLTRVTDALTIQSNNAEESGKTQLAILQTLTRSEDSLLRLTNCVTNPLNNNCEGLGGDGGDGNGNGNGNGNTGGPITETDILDIKNALWASNNILGGVYSNVGSINDNIDYLNRKMAWDVDAIKGMMQNNQGSGGGSGGEGGSGIDYSQMPGSSQNPLHVAGADYESKLCQGDVNCAFDLGTINQRYEEQKEALKNQYKGIQTEISEMFKFHLGGSASAPKCFDMFSIFGKSYSICPDSGAYWEALAAIMMFIFYFIALMIVARR